MASACQAGFCAGRQNRSRRRYGALGAAVLAPGTGRKVRRVPRRRSRLWDRAG